MYRGIIYLNEPVRSPDYKTIKEVQNWIDAQNNNHEYKSIVEEVDKDGNMVDWYYYTEG